MMVTQKANHSYEAVHIGHSRDITKKGILFQYIPVIDY